MAQLSVHIDEKSGFCFGVVYAIQMAEDVLDEEGKLYCLGEIVHNDEEVRRLSQKGLKIIKHADLYTLKAGEKVLIRAHGEPPSTYQIAFERQLHLLDASCPVVLQLQHDIHQSQSEQEHIYIYGMPGHPEVLALLGQLKNKATVFQSFEELDIAHMPPHITIYSQTTKAVAAFYDIVKKLREAGISVKMHDTICRQVSNRERDIQHFARRYNKIIFVSGTRSSNGKGLYQTCKKINKHTFFISHEHELSCEWFAEGDTVGVCGATSTPTWLMQNIRDKILALKF